MTAADHCRPQFRMRRKAQRGPVGVLDAPPVLSPASPPVRVMSGI
jgi:hypothetical protein